MPGCTPMSLNIAVVTSTITFHTTAQFQYGGLPGSKKAFCLEDTDRTHNDELTLLTPNHQSCQFQGITAGWGDEYQFGLPCQGVDITDGDTDSTNPADTTLSFTANPDQFICEGFPVLDSSGNLIFDPTSFISDNGLPVSRERCNFTPGWAANNLAQYQDHRLTMGPVSSAKDARMARLVPCAIAVSRRSQSRCRVAPRGRPFTSVVSQGPFVASSPGLREKRSAWRGGLHFPRLFGQRALSIAGR